MSIRSFNKCQLYFRTARSEGSRRAYGRESGAPIRLERLSDIYSYSLRRWWTHFRRCNKSIFDEISVFHRLQEEFPMLQLFRAFFEPNSKKGPGFPSELVDYIFAIFLVKMENQSILARKILKFSDLCEFPTSCLQFVSSVPTNISHIFDLCFLSLLERLAT